MRIPGSLKPDISHAPPIIRTRGRMETQAFFASRKAQTATRRIQFIRLTRIDRLARSLPHLLQIVERLEKKDVALRILSMQIDTSTPNGKLMLSIMGAIAEFELTLMLERQLDGIAAAKQAGKYKGRQPTAKRKADTVLALAAQKITREEIAKQTGIGIASVYRILSAAKKAA